MTYQEFPHEIIRLHEKHGFHYRNRITIWKEPLKVRMRTMVQSLITWQRYASSVWDDVRIDNVLPFRDSKEEDDEKHVHPLQLDVIDRLVELYSNPPAFLNYVKPLLCLGL